jgi:hypothetical protein
VTKKQRDEVIMLLRCAADQLLTVGHVSIGSAAVSLGVSSRSRVTPAVDAFLSVYFRSSRDDKHADLLEAALLVEEGSLP